MNKKIKVILLLLVGIGGLLYFGNMFVFNNLKDTGDLQTDTNIEESADKNDSENKEDIAPETDQDPDIAIGALAPDFTLKNLEGKEVSLSDYRGKVVLVNFWATTCGFCDKEMPDLDAIDKENDDVVVLAVDVMEKESKVKSYIEKGGYGFEVVLDEKGDIARTYLVSGFPTTAVVNKEGILVSGRVGMLTKEQMKIEVENARGKQ